MDKKLYTLWLRFEDYFFLMVGVGLALVLRYSLRDFASMD
jgi:hypothetical protein